MVNVRVTTIKTDPRKTVLESSRAVEAWPAPGQSVLGLRCDNDGCRLIKPSMQRQRSCRPAAKDREHERRNAGSGI